MTQLLALDEQVFSWLNQVYTHPWLDAIMPWWRDKTSWAPLYVLAAGGLWWYYRQRGLVLLLLIGLTVGLSDQISSELIKKSVQRDRPCREQSLVQPARVLVGCGGGYSFPSSHATNHFALATLLFLSWGRKFRSWRWILLLWAASIAYGQVYVGVHYPLDVSFGALLGATLGLLAYQLYRRLKPDWTIPEFMPEA